MKMSIKINQFFEKFNNWINGIIVAGVAVIFSLGNAATGLCSTGNCGSACGYKCVGLSAITLIIVGFKCRKNKIKDK